MNDRMKFRMTVFIVLFLLLAAAVVYLIIGTGSGNESADKDYSLPSLSFGTSPLQNYSPSPAAPAAYTPVPAAVPAAPVPTPMPTPVPTPLPTPVPTPMPTPEPTIPPLPAGTVLNSGSFVSSTGTLMDIHADWSAVVENDVSVSVNVNVYADHYSLTCIAGRTLNIALGENTITLEVPVIEYSGSPRISTLLGTGTLSVPMSTGQSVSLPFDAKWHFNGDYSNTHLDYLECSGIVDFQR